MVKVKVIVFVFLIFIIYQVIPAQSTQFKALVVGVADYSAQSGYDDIASGNTVNDATDMAFYLEYYQGWNSSDIEIKVNSAASASAIETYISNMPNTAGTSELFFYSGHGDDDQEGIIPYTGKINATDLLNAFGNDYYQFCCIFNACHSGYFKYNMPRGEILTSSMQIELSHANGPDNNSVFSYYILEGLKNNQADPASGHVVSAKDLYDYAATDARDYAWEEHRFDMHPQYQGNLKVFNFQDLQTTSGQLFDDEIWSNVTLSGNVVVPSGKTLVLAPGATVNLNGFTIESTGGTIEFLNGAVSNSLVVLLTSSGNVKKIYPSSQLQQVINILVYPQIIYLSAGNYTGNFNLRNYTNILGNEPSNTIINGDLNINNKSNVWIRSVTVDRINDNYGLYNWANDVYVDEHNTYYNSQSELYYCVVASSSDNRSVEAEYYTEMEIENCVFRNKSYVGVYAEWYTDMQISNTDFCQNNIDVYGEGPGGQVSLSNCWFSGSTEGSTIDYDDYTISWTSWSYCGSYSPDEKPRDDNQITVNINSTDTGPGKSAYQKVRNRHKNLKQTISNSRLSNNNFSLQSYKNEFESLIYDYEDVINNYPGTEVSLLSLDKIVKLYRTLNEPNTGLEKIKSVIENRKFENYVNHIKSFSIPLYLDKMEYENALTVTDELLKDLPKGDHHCKILYGKGVIYKFLLNDNEKGNEVFASLIENYPDDNLAETAMHYLESDYDGSNGQLAKLENEQNNSVILSSHPNPFNPSTNISFSLPERAEVNIKVFDVLGQEVAELVNGIKDIGTYTIQFDGGNLASGIYIVNLQAINKTSGKVFTKSQKILLAK